MKTWHSYYISGRQWMKKILIVDDEKYIRSLIKEYFALESYLVYTAKNGEEAFERLTYNPDLILLDVMMTKMDGFEVCTMIGDQ